MPPSPFCRPASKTTVPVASDVGGGQHIIVAGDEADFDIG